ncbi:D-Ala-D-Ala carboxypeptidase family metallohydrolase, partial [Campylobacter jejuni]
MKNNPYFKESEFKCKCGKCELPQNVPSDELIDILCKIREHYNAPIIINSGYRCKEHNANVGGAPKSQHTIGSAA